ncbi:hypothetical protein C8R45DRAFT_1107132 [Mycena sanguinolenta]|nr:hypothetical protein C8R45DRAFT_1107132 [Mycena sanguinolenta]
MPQVYTLSFLSSLSLFLKFSLFVAPLTEHPVKWVCYIHMWTQPTGASPTGHRAHSPVSHALRVAWVPEAGLDVLTFLFIAIQLSSCQNMLPYCALRHVAASREPPPALKSGSALTYDRTHRPTDAFKASTTHILQRIVLKLGNPILS